MRRSAAIAVCAVALTSCRDPTQIRLEVHTDALCTDLQATNITVGRLVEMEAKPPSASTTACDPSTGRIGSIVVVPSGDKDESVALRVVTGLGLSPESCIENGYKGGCIVARRALHYIPHETLELPVMMSLECRDRPCDETETCFNGDCIPAEVDCASPGKCVPSFDGGASGAGGEGGTAGGGGSGGSGGMDASAGSGGLAGMAGASGSGGGCAAPLAECDGDPTSSCETNLLESESHCGACGVSCFTGTCNAGSCEPVLVAASTGSATAIASDAQNVYWSDPSAGLIRRASLSGGAPVTLASSQAFAQGVAVDATHVYWANWTNNGRVARVPIGGGGVEVLLAAEPFPADVAVDDTHVYFTAGNSNAGSVRRVAKAGGAVQVLAQSQVFPYGIAADTTHIYWANWTANGAVNRIAKDGTGGVAAVTATEKSPYAVALFEGTLYFTLYNAQGQVRSVDAQANAGASALIASSLSKPTSVAADASGVWWTTEGDAVQHLPPGATTPITIASGVAGLEDIAVGPKAVCWAAAAGPFCKGK